MDSSMKSSNSKSHNSDSHSTSLSSTLRGTKKKTFDAVEKKKWKTLRRTLKSRFGKELCVERERSGLTLLAACAGFNAPVDVLQLVHDLDPTQTLEQDDYGAVPLHVACLNGSETYVIDFLIQVAPEALLVADIDQRIPLHHAMECLCQREVSIEQGKSNILRLFQGDSSTINYCDKNGDTPVDMVQIARNTEFQRQINIGQNCHATLTSDAMVYLEDVYKFVLSLSIMEYTRKKRLWECQTSHVAMDDDLSPQSDKNSNSSLFNMTLPSQISHEYNFDDITMEE